MKLLLAVLLAMLTLSVGAQTLSTDVTFQTTATQPITFDPLADFGGTGLSIASFSRNGPRFQGSLQANGDGTFTYNPTGYFNYLSAGQFATNSFTCIVTNNLNVQSPGVATNGYIWCFQSNNVVQLSIGDTPFDGTNFFPLPLAPAGVIEGFSCPYLLPVHDTNGNFQYFLLSMQCNGANFDNGYFTVFATSPDLINWSQLYTNDLGIPYPAQWSGKAFEDAQGNLHYTVGLGTNDPNTTGGVAWMVDINATNFEAWSNLRPMLGVTNAAGNAPGGAPVLGYSNGIYYAYATVDGIADNTFIYTNSTLSSNGWGQVSSIFAGSGPTMTSFDGVNYLYYTYGGSTFDSINYSNFVYVPESIAPLVSSEGSVCYASWGTIAARAGQSTELTVFLVVSGINMPPAVNNMVVYHAPGQPAIIPVSNLLSASHDAYGNPVYLKSFDTVSANGAFVSETNDMLYYIPLSGIDAADSFGYTMFDSHGLTATANVSVLDWPTNLLVINVGGLAVTNVFTAITFGSSEQVVADGQNIAIQFIGQPRKLYTVGYSTDLIKWTVAGSESTDANGILVVRDIAPADSERFYRIVSQ